MQRMFLVLAASAAALASFATPPVVAAPKPKTDPSQCFRVERMTNWQSDDNRNVYVRLNTGEVFQLTLVGECPGLTLYHVLAFDTNFSSKVCNGRPATIITRSGAGPLHCAVKTVRPLTADETAALTDKQKP